MSKSIVVAADERSTSAEFDRLIAAAKNGPPVMRLSGPDRAILYIIAGYTGYRRGEIGSITATSFDFDADPPTLTVKAGHSKRRRTDVIPLRPDFAIRIRHWIDGRQTERDHRCSTSTCGEQPT